MPRTIYLLFQTILLMDFLLVHSTEELPSYVKRCSKKFATNKCIVENINAIKGHLAEGIPALGIAPLRPYYLVPHMVSKNDKFQLDCRNYKLFNLEDFEVEKVDLDLKGGLFDLSFEWPFLKGESLYLIQGDVYSYKLNSSGIVVGNLTDLVVNIGMKGKQVEVDGEHYLDLKVVSFKRTLKVAKAVFENIFPDDPEATRKANEVINEHLVEFVYAIKPIFADEFKELVEKVVAKLFSTHSIERLFVE